MRYCDWQENEMGMFGWFRATCPVDVVTRQWIDTRWCWLTDQFGGDLLIDSPTVLPTPEFFPDEYDASEEAVRVLVSRVCDCMHVSRYLVDVHFYSEADRPQFVDGDGHELGGTAGLYEEGARCTIHLEQSQAHEPMLLVGTIAHELAHQRLLGENRLSPDAFDNELLTDLTVVFHGMGIFLANAPRHWTSDATCWPGTELFKPEYMTTPMYGYALALRCWLREEPLPAWRKHLASGVRAEFKQALRFLESEARRR
jgi:hypothetical protein